MQETSASLETCEKLVYTCCQINATTVIENFNIVIYGAVEQLDMAKKALSACTKHQSILYCCDKAVTDDSGKSLLPQ